MAPGRDAVLKTQVKEFQTAVAALLAQNQALTQASGEKKGRVPPSFPRFKGTKSKNVRQWLFEIENACFIRNYPTEETCVKLPRIAGSAIDEPAKGWFLH